MLPTYPHFFDQLVFEITNFIPYLIIAVKAFTIDLLVILSKFTSSLQQQGQFVSMLTVFTMCIILDTRGH